MQVDQRLNLASKETWTEKNAETIAGLLGYVFTPAFAEAYGKFVISTVRTAKITLLLNSIAQNHFGKVTPPLERIKRG